MAMDCVKHHGIVNRKGRCIRSGSAPGIHIEIFSWCKEEDLLAEDWFLVDSHRWFRDKRGSGPYFNKSRCVHCPAKDGCEINESDCFCGTAAILHANGRSNFSKLIAREKKCHERIANKNEPRGD
jgi:hypothetical protein